MWSIWSLLVVGVVVEVQTPTAVAVVVLVACLQDFLV
jgi:hypothetical protein